VVVTDANGTSTGGPSYTYAPVEAQPRIPTANTLVEPAADSSR
jgi:hypothetical protein